MPKDLSYTDMHIRKEHPSILLLSKPLGCSPELSILEGLENAGIVLDKEIMTKMIVWLKEMLDELDDLEERE